MTDIKELVEKIKEFGYSQANITGYNKNPDGSENVLAEVKDESGSFKTCAFKFDTEGKPIGSICFDKINNS